MSNVEQSGDRVAKLELDIDLRCREVLWLLFDVNGSPDPELAIRLLRAAYARGYMDALQEPFRGQLCKDNGYKIPKRREFG